MKPGRVLVAGASTRAAAESAACAGFDVTAIDAFADVDQHPAVQALSTPDTFTARSAAETSRRFGCDAVTYLSPFENDLDAIRTLASNRTLWGNPPEIVRRVRDPFTVAEAFQEAGFAVPRVRRGSLSESRPAPRSGASVRWLLKRFASGGGHRVRPWSDGQDVPRGCYLQEFMDGIPGSVAFASAQGRAAPMGIFRQLIGDAAFGASGFTYCGNILTVPGDRQDDDAVIEAACGLAQTVAETFGTVGVNGIDFVARDRIAYPIEINPRWCASMELAERAFGLSIFETHASACTTGTLPVFDIVQARRALGAAWGKAVVFAREDVLVRDARVWMRRGSTSADASTRDIPPPGTRIRAGRPVCTVFAEGPNVAGCYAALVERATSIYNDLAAWQAGGTRVS